MLWVFGSLLFLYYTSLLVFCYFTLADILRAGLHTHECVNAHSVFLDMGEHGQLGWKNVLQQAL